MICRGSQNTAANPDFDCRLLKRLNPLSSSGLVLDGYFCKVCLLDEADSPGRSRPRSMVVAELDGDCRSRNASSPEYEAVMLCEIAISRARSTASSHSCAAAEVAEPSDEDGLGSSKVKCLSR